MNSDEADKSTARDDLVVSLVSRNAGLLKEWFDDSPFHRGNLGEGEEPSVLNKIGNIQKLLDDEKEIAFSFIDAATYFPVIDDKEYLHEQIVCSNKNGYGAAFIKGWTKIVNGFVEQGFSPGLHPLFLGAIGNIVSRTDKSPGVLPKFLWSTSSMVQALEHKMSIKQIEDIQIDDEDEAIVSDEGGCTYARRYLSDLNRAAFVKSCKNVERITRKGVCLSEEQKQIILVQDLKRRHAEFHANVTKYFDGEDGRVPLSKNAVLVSLPLSVGFRDMYGTDIPGGVSAGAWILLDPKPDASLVTGENDLVDPVLNLLGAILLILTSAYERHTEHYIRERATRLQYLLDMKGPRHLSFLRDISDIFRICYRDERVSIRKLHPGAAHYKAIPRWKEILRIAEERTPQNAYDEEKPIECFLELLTFRDGRRVFGWQVELVLELYLREGSDLCASRFEYKEEFQDLSFLMPVKPGFLFLGALLELHHNFVCRSGVNDENVNPIVFSVEKTESQDKKKDVDVTFVVISIKPSDPSRFWSRVVAQHDGNVTSSVSNLLRCSTEAFAEDLRLSGLWPNLIDELKSQRNKRLHEFEVETGRELIIKWKVE